MSRYLCLPPDFRPEQGWVYGGLEAFVDCGPYLGGDHDVRWCKFLRLAPGSAAVFPVKVQVPNRGEGQYKFEEVEAWRYERSVLEALFHHHIDGEPTPLPPGIDVDWLAREIGALP